jgi:anti-sigma B factor antagonist
VAWLALGGELDVFTAARVRAILRDLREREWATLVFDLRSITLLDSSGLAALLGAHERAQLDGDQAVKMLIKGSAAVESLFATIRAAEYLDMIESPADLHLAALGHPS